MHGVLLDAASLGEIDISPIIDCFDTFEQFPTTQITDIESRIQAADVVLTNKISLDARAIDSAKRLKLICAVATGTNNIDLDAATRRSIPVCNAIGYGTPSVAQHTLGLMLNLATSFPRYQDDIIAGEWQKSEVFTLLNHPIIELSGKTLGILGKGELGTAVARLAEAFGMKVLFAARKGSHDNKDRIPLDNLLGEIDFLSLHCPLNAETSNLINERTLALMQSHAFLINTARGGLVDSQALITALRNGRLAGAAIDVLNEEPARDSEPLIKHVNIPNLILTPHNAWGAIEARHRLVAQVKENILQFKNGSLIRRVNLAD